MRTSRQDFALFTALALAVGSLAAAPAEAAGNPAPARAAARSVALEWRPAIELGDLGPVDVSGLTRLTVQVQPLRDARPEGRRLGEARYEGADEVVPLTAAGDVAKFVTERLGALLAEMGMTVVPRAATVVLAGEVRRFWATEGELYQAEVELEVSLSTRQGAELWRGVVVGAAGRYGVPGQAEVLQEVLSDALFQVVHGLVTEPEARAALRALAGS
jgi:hypothetical protein